MTARILRRPGALAGELMVAALLLAGGDYGAATAQVAPATAAAAAVFMPPQELEKATARFKRDQALARARHDEIYDLDRAPRHTQRVLLRAAELVNHGRHEQGIDLLREHLRDHPDQEHGLLHLHLAQDLADAGRTAEARDHYRRAAELEPALDRAWFGLADTAYDLEEFAVAADAFARGFETSFERAPQALFFAASSWLLAGEPARALPFFARLTGDEQLSVLPPGAVPQPPDIKWVRGYLAAANEAGQPELVGPAVQKLMAARPADPEVWYLEYQYEAARRDFAAATVALRVVGFLRPLSTVEEKQLGDLLMVSGVAHLASDHYQRGLGGEAAAGEVERLASALVTAHETGQALRVLRDALAAAPEDERLWSLVGDVHYLRQEYAEALAAFGHVAAGDASGRAWLMQGYCALELGRRGEALDLLARASSFPEQADLAQRLIQRALRLADS